MVRPSFQSGVILQAGAAGDVSEPERPASSGWKWVYSKDQAGNTALCFSQIPDGNCHSLNVMFSEMYLRLGYSS